MRRTPARPTPARRQRGTRSAFQRDRERRAAPTIVADIALTAGFAALAMAVVVVITGINSRDEAFGEAGLQIAIYFAAALLVAALFLLLLGIALLRDYRAVGESYYAPAAIGVVIGAVGTVLLVDLQVFWLWIPPLFVFFALRPVRRVIFAPFYGRSAR